MFGKVILLFILCHISGAKADCDSLPTVENTSNNATGSGPFVTGTVIRFECLLGFNPSGTSKEYKCSGTKWVDGNLFCEEIFCKYIEPPENGKIANVPTYKVGTIIQFECNEGYNMVGSSNKMLCRINGKWNPEQPPVCNIKMCGEFGSIQHGDTFQDSSYIVRNGYGSVVEVTCDDGYMMKGSPNVKCLATGYWDEKPTCVVSQCSLYPGLNSSCIKEVNPLGTFLFIKCRDDVPVTKTGPDKADCIRGAWDNTEMACYCDCKVEADSKTMSLGNLEDNGYLRHGTKLEWSCKKDYEKKTQNEFVCYDGNVIKPVCESKYEPTDKPVTVTYKPITDENGSTVNPPPTTSNNEKMKPLPQKSNNLVVYIIIGVCGFMLLVVLPLICYCVPYCKKNCCCIVKSESGFKFNANCILNRSLSSEGSEENLKSCEKCGKEKDKCQCIKLMNGNGDAEGDAV